MAKKNVHIVDLQTADKVTGEEYLVLQDAQGIEYVLVGELESAPVFTPGQYYVKQGDSYVALDEIPENWSEMYQTTYTRNTPDTKKAKIKDALSEAVSGEIQGLKTTVQENADALQQNIIKTAENTEAINLLTENDRLQDDTLQDIIAAQQNSIGQKGTGTNAEIFNDYSGNSASGPLAHSEGSKTTSSGEASHSEGIGTTATGVASHSEGKNSSAEGEASHSEGFATQAKAVYSHSEGQNSVANGFSSHAEGSAITNGKYSHAEGRGTIANGDYSHAEGDTSIAGVKGYTIVAANSSTSTIVLSSTGNLSVGAKIGIYDKKQADNRILSVATITSIDTKGNIVVKMIGEAPFSSYFTVGNIVINMSFVTSYTGSEDAIVGGHVAHAEGQNTKAIGTASHAEGNTTTANGEYSHTEGSYTETLNDYAHAEGYNAKARGIASHSEGTGTEAIGTSAHAEGISTKAIGDISHSEGNNSIANGKNSHAEGYGSKTGIYGCKVVSTDETAQSAVLKTVGNLAVGTGIGTYQSSYGIVKSIGTIKTIDNSTKTVTFNLASGVTFSNVIFEGAILVNVSTFTDSDDTESIVGGNDGAHSEGRNTKAIGASSHAEGNTTTANGASSHAEGNGNIAGGASAHAEGVATKAMGEGSHAENGSTQANGGYSHSEGWATKANGKYSHSEGRGTIANGENSHAEGYWSTAAGRASHAEGSSDAEGECSHAEGDTRAEADYSHTEGLGTITASNSQHAQGKFNIIDSDNKYAHIVGNGSSGSDRSNAHTVDWSGNSWYRGKIKIGGTGYNDTNAKEMATDDIIQPIKNLNTMVVIPFKKLIDLGADSISKAKTIATINCNYRSKVSYGYCMMFARDKLYSCNLYFAGVDNAEEGMFYDITLSDGNIVSLTFQSFAGGFDIGAYYKTKSSNPPINDKIVVLSVLNYIDNTDSLA